MKKEKKVKVKGQRTERKVKLKSMAEGSFICRALDRLASIFYKKAEDGVVGGVMTAEEKVNEGLHSGILASLAQRFNKSKKVKGVVARGCEESRILGFFGRVMHGFGCISLRVYGVYFIFFSLVGALGSYFRIMGVSEDERSYLSFIVCGAMLLSGLTMLFSGKSFMHKAMQNGLLSTLIVNVLGIRPASLDFPVAGSGRALAAIFLGALSGLSAFVLEPLFLILGFLLLVALYVILLVPESGVLLTVIGVCFLPTMVLVAMVAYTFVCYLLKLLRGKRTFRFNAMDCAVLVFFIFMMGGGVSSVGRGASLQPALVYLCFMLGYFLVVNLVRGEFWLKRCLGAVVIGAVLVSGYGVYQNFFGEQDTTWQDTEMFEEISGRVVSTFENPNVLGEYLIMVIPLLLAFAVVSKKPSTGFASLLMFALGCACLIYTWSRGAWLGMILAMLVFFLVYTRKTMAVCLAALFLIPFLPLVLPETILTRFTSIGDLGDSSTSYRVSIWVASMKVIENHPFAGIGIGTGAFSKVYPLYSLSGIEKAPHSHNLFLQTAIEIGIPGLLVLLGVIFIFAQNSFSFFKKCKNGVMKEGKIISLALFAGIMGVLLQGLTDYIWYNYRLYLMFWIVIGLAEAVRRVSVESEGPDLRAGYN